MRIKKELLEQRLNKIRTTLDGEDFLNIEEISKNTKIPRSTIGRYIRNNLKDEVRIKSYGNVVLIKKK
jgi:DeoR/GlpR family transcriptional regulator of sugar metabolism